MDLDKLYRLYNRREYIHPDPLEFLYNYDQAEDREIVAIIASCLAYGRVSQILKSVDSVLVRMVRGPRDFLYNTENNNIRRVFEGFKHRFTTDTELADFLIGIKKSVLKHGSLKNCFNEKYSEKDTDFTSALKAFVDEIKAFTGTKKSSLLCEPALGSACKRLNLFLRWMIRKDDVDPGGWDELPASKLLVPLDTHMYRFGITCGFTKRKNADLKTAMEITNGLKKYSHDDPVKYDFVITRFGIRDDLGLLSQACQHAYLL
ncbi:MAG: TIGR02757 family protein [Oligoflexia bacterium]|nr:TIGR02757 family protein [Oligoflexia bacterium]